MANVLISTDGLPYEKWLEFRKQGIGGSDAAAVCGISRYKSTVELWLEKTDKLPPQDAGESAYWGTQLEPLVRQEFTRRTGIEVTTLNQLLQSEEHPFMLANLDGVCEHPELGECIFEAKTASAFKAAEWENTIPDEYMLQIQHYMAVTGCKAAYIAVLIGGNTFRWRLVERDDELISMLVELETQFWEYVCSDTPPPLDGSEACARFLTERYSECDSGTSITLPDNADELIQLYNSACVQLDSISQQKRKAENLLKDLLGRNESGSVGSSVVSWKAVSQERLDTKLLKAEQPTLYKKYSTESTYRRFTVKTN